MRQMMGLREKQEIERFVKAKRKNFSMTEKRTGTGNKGKGETSMPPIAPPPSEKPNGKERVYIL